MYFRIDSVFFLYLMLVLSVISLLFLGLVLFHSGNGSDASEETSKGSLRFSEM